MSELEQYLAMLKRAQIEYETFKRDDGSVSIIVESLRPTIYHRFSATGQLIGLGGSH